MPSWSWPVNMPEHWKLVGRAEVGVPVRDSVRTKASYDPQAAEQAEAKTKAQTEAHTEVQTEEWTGRPQLYLQMINWLRVQELLSQSRRSSGVHGATRAAPCFHHPTHSPMMEGEHRVHAYAGAGDCGALCWRLWST